MSARARIALVVGVAALAAVGAAVAIAVLSADDGDGAAATTAPGPRTEPPPLSLELGFREDAEAVDLRRAQRLLASGEPAEARRLFARHDSLEARVGRMFASWPDRSLARLEQLAGLYPSVPVVQLNLGIARFWGRRGDPREAWRKALEEAPDTPYALRAENLLFPDFAENRPVFVPSFGAPEEVTRLPPERQVEALRRRAEDGGPREQLLLGVALQRIGRPVSAQRAYDAAARGAPADAEAQVAAAVGRFRKEDPSAAFSRLGPLTRRFPGEPTVRFHLGLLLLWTGELEEAKTQLRRAARTQPGSALARTAARYLAEVERAGTDSTG
jgi:tetratricopeptide (TPR) repeat protein